MSLEIKNDGRDVKRATTSRVREKKAVMQNDQSGDLNRWEKKIKEERREGREKRRKENTGGRRRIEKQ